MFERIGIRRSEAEESEVNSMGNCGLPAVNLSAPLQDQDWSALGLYSLVPRSGVTGSVRYTYTWPLAMLAARNVGRT